jgi:hypothetical protein
VTRALDTITDALNQLHDATDFSGGLKPCH